MKRSAGLLPFQTEGLLFRGRDALRVLIAHPGGPYFAGRDQGAWSIVKGRIEIGEDPLTAARREFREETGWPPPEVDPLPLGEIVQRGGKTVTAFAVEVDLDITTFDPGLFQMYWRGRLQSFPEIDEVRWTSLSEAESLLNAAQIPFLRRLDEALQQHR